MKHASLWLFLPTAVVLCQPANADVAGRYENTDKNAPLNLEITVEADELNNARIQMSIGTQYYLYRDGAMYVVTAGGDKPKVMRLEDLLTVQAEAIARIGWKVPPSAESLPKFQFAPMQEETVSGRRGMGYGIVAEDQETPKYASMVISDDPQLAKLGQAMAHANEASVKGLGSMGTMFQMMNSEMLSMLGKGAPLRMLDIELTDVSFEAIPPERFDLPAEPLTVDEARKLLTSPTIAPPPTLPQRKEQSPRTRG